MSESISVMLVEDNAEYRAVVNLALDDERGIELISEFGTPEIALRTLLDNSKNHPDVILLDLRLPGMSGLEALPYFKEYSPASKVIILTQSDNESDVLQAITLGASGYLLKSATISEILQGIRTVIEGGASLDASVAKFILENLQNRLPKEKVKVELSQREMEILDLLSQGLVKKQIAEQLEIGYSTVDTHVGHIYEKLQVKNAPAAVGKAFRMGIFTPNKK
ncbi:MAG: response regulator transcription factor [Opitutales bacterium]|nr:response regulator transcription factor [Opitutales bacterium]